MKIDATRHAKARAFARLGTCPQISWWQLVAEHIANLEPLRTFTTKPQSHRHPPPAPRACEVHEVHAAGVDGEDVVLHVVIQRKARRMVFVTLWVESVDGHVWAPINKYIAAARQDMQGSQP